ncbi:MAG: protease complex subunit PrcB family protein, partial [Telluria sp.]
GPAAGPSNQQASPGVTVGEKHPGAGDGPVSTELFLARARSEPCADTRNRLFAIDGKMVFWDRAGSCADNAYARRLYGPTPDILLCESYDSIAGPRTVCINDASRDLFNTMINNLERADLGIGRDYKVEALPILPAGGAGIAFTSVASDAFSGVRQAATVVIKDAASFNALWARHGAGREPAPEQPRIDFGAHMVVGVFAGEGGNGCRQLNVTKVVSGAGKIVVSFEERDLQTFAVCTQATSAPMHLVAIPRSDVPVEFVNTRPSQLVFKELDRSTRSLIAQPRNVVVKDAQAFAALWAEHTGSAVPAPTIDFGRSMVVGVFLGSRMNGCYATDIASVSRENGKITVSRVDTEPGAGAICTMAIVNPAHLVVIERSDDPVEFTSQRKPLT